MPTLTAAQITTIRLEIADRGNQPQFSDTEIQAVYDANGETIGGAVIALIEAQIADVAGRPDFAGGTLKVEHGRRLTGLRLLLATKRNKYRTYPAAVIGDDDD